MSESAPVDPVPTDSGPPRVEATGTDTPVVTLWLHHPRRLNAMTWAMYDQLEAHLVELARRDDLRAVVLRGAGDRAFVAGTDISQFHGFDGARGIDYEQRVAAVVDRVLRFPRPTVAAVQGPAVGAGLVLSAACDLVIARTEARFGAPVARTLGNVIDLPALAVLHRRLGPGWLRRMLLAADLVPAADLIGCGLVARLGDDLDALLDTVLAGLVASAPLTLQGTKDLLTRLEAADVPDGADVVAAVYGSGDFAEGVAAFSERRPPVWQGS